MITKRDDQKVIELQMDARASTLRCSMRYETDLSKNLDQTTVQRQYKLMYLIERNGSLSAENCELIVTSYKYPQH